MMGAQFQTDQAAITFNGVTYYRPYVLYGDQIRGMGWGLRLLGAVNHLNPASEPDAQYWTDLYNDNANLLVPWIASRTTAQASLGYWYGEDQASFIEPWMEDFLWSAICMEALRGDNASWLQVIAYFKQFVTWRGDPSHGGSGYYASIRYLFPVSTPTTWPGLYEVTATTDAQSSPANNNFVSVYASSGNPAALADTGYATYALGQPGNAAESGGMLPDGDVASGSGSFPWGPNDLGTFWLCSMELGRILGVENCAAMETEARARIAASVALARVTGYPASLTNFPAFIWS
jgi:hypothetical protein